MSARPVDGGRRVHQFTAVLTGRDAVGHHTLTLDDLLRDMGCETAIYAAHVHPDLADRGRDFRLHPGDPPPDLLVYQASTGTPVADYVLGRPEPLVVNYHNMTPAPFFDPWEPSVAAELDHGRRQLARLARRARLGMADSDYNAGELRELGCTDVETTGIFLSAPLRDGRDVAEVPAGPGSVVRVLFVGRLAPNKCQHDVIAAVAVLEGLLADSGRSVELVLVGGSSSVGFEAALRGLVSGLGLDGRVVFAGSVSEAELARWYSVADVFVCLSEHEGFGVPLVEAMAAGVPVVAFGAAAVPETVGSAGVVLGDKSPVVVAEAVLRVVSDEGVRRALVEAGLARVAELGPEVAGARMREVLAPVLAEAGA